MRFPVPLKLILAFAVVIATVAVTSWTTLRGIDSIEATTINKLRDDTIPGLDQMGRLSYHFAVIRGNFWRYVHFTDPAVREKNGASLANERKQLAEIQKKYVDSISRDEDRQLFAALSQNIAMYFVIFDKALAAIASKDQAEFDAQAKALAVHYNTEVDPRLNTLIEKNSLWAKEACDLNLAVAEDVRTNTKYGLLVTIGLAVIAAGLLCWSILPRLAACRRSVVAMSGGSLDDGMDDAARHKLASGGDELGDIGRAVVDLRGYMSDMSTTANAIASGDLRIETKVRGTGDLLGNAFKTMSGNLRTSMDTISRSAQTLAGASEELSASSTQLDGNATEAAARTQTAAAATEEVNRGIQSVASAAEEMATSVKEISGQTQGMATKVGQAADAAQAMTKATKSVDEIAATIAGIAEQTNLLALNATIEAARAGDAGRGFAVVAGEVKALASQTAEATRNITSILGELRSHVQTVASGTSEVRDATSAVASAVEEQNATTAEIGRSMSEAAQGSQEIASSVTAAATAVTEAKQGAAQVREAAGSLARIATELQQAVAGFKI